VKNLTILSIEFKQSNCECKGVSITDRQLEGICVCDQVVVLTHSKYRKACKEDKALFKGARYLLLKNRRNLRRLRERQQLRQLLVLNEVINTVLIFKEKHKHIWTYRSRSLAGKAFDQWRQLARSEKNRSPSTFGNTLQRYRYGILNYCDYPIHNGKLEGVNT
jgi:transposase